MPKQKRWTIKRNLDFTLKNIDLAIDNIAKAGHEFEYVHPEIYAHFAAIASALASVHSAIAQLRDEI